MNLLLKFRQMLSGGLACRKRFGVIGMALARSAKSGVAVLDIALLGFAGMITT
jgi:hypothetical protein